MPDTSFSIPTPKEVVDRVRADMDAQPELAAAPATLRWFLANIIAPAFALTCWTGYGLIKRAAREILPDTCTVLTAYRHASNRGMRPRDPSAARGPVSVTGTTGRTLPAGAALTLDGRTYTVDEEQVWTEDGTKTVAITAAEAGAAGNVPPELAAGVVLQLVSPPIGITPSCPLQADGLIGGADEETWQDLIKRLLEFLRDPPQGSADADYRKWAREVATVARVWPFGETPQPGHVTLWFTVDDTGDGYLPGPDKVEEVRAYIEEGTATVKPRKPLHVTLHVAAPTTHAVPLGITVSPNTDPVKDAVAAQLTSLFRTRVEPKSLTRNGLLRSYIERAVGLDWYTLNAVDGGGPNGDVDTTATGALAVLGPITWGTP